jgi:carbon storage regulator CsrA
MLVLTRNIGDKIEIVVDGTTKIQIEFLNRSNDRRFRVGINAPRNCEIHRDNIKQRKEKENK